MSFSSLVSLIMIDFFLLSIAKSNFVPYTFPQTKERRKRGFASLIHFLVLKKPKAYKYPTNNTRSLRSNLSCHDSGKFTLEGFFQKLFTQWGLIYNKLQRGFVFYVGVAINTGRKLEPPVPMTGQWIPPVTAAGQVRGKTCTAISLGGTCLRGQSRLWSWRDRAYVSLLSPLMLRYVCKLEASSLSFPKMWKQEKANK